ncbi:hypothetical protein QQ045_003400 [Rhodiola kirilowii]
MSYLFNAVIAGSTMYSIVDLSGSTTSKPCQSSISQLWYAYAKTIGEQEAWKFAQENAIDLVVVNPSFVIGPLLAPQPTSTLLMVLAIIKGLSGEYPNTTVGFVHIDDVIEAHILAMEETKSSSRRLICSGAVAHWSEIGIPLNSIAAISRRWIWIAMTCG